MSFFSDIFNTISGWVTGSSSSGGSSGGSSGPPPIAGGGNYQTPSGGTNWGNLIGGLVQFTAPLITASVTKPNKPKYPTLPDSVKNDPRFQQLIGPYGGGVNAPTIEPLSPFQIAFGTMLQNAFYEPAGVPQEEQKTKEESEDPMMSPEAEGDLLNQGPVVEKDLPLPSPFKVDMKAVANVEKFGTFISDAAAKYGVPENLIKATIAAESGGNPNVESKIKDRAEGALGLGQLLRSTADQLAGTKLTRDQVLNPKSNIDFTAQLLGQLLNKYEGDYEKVIGAYNAGEKAVDSGRYKSFRETRAHIPKVLGWMNYYDGRQR